MLPNPSFNNTSGLPPFFTQVSMGRVPGFYSVTVTGSNPVITSTPESLWDSNTVEVIHQNAERVEFVSTSAQDNPAGTGVRRVIIWGLDGDYVYQSEEIIPNGTTPVVSQFEYIAVNSAENLEVGSSGAPAGICTYTQETSGELMHINRANAEPKKATYVVPNDYHALLYRAQITALEPDSQLRARLQQVNPNDVEGGSIIQMNATPQLTVDLTAPFLVKPRYTMRLITGESSGNNTTVSGNFSFILVHNTLVNDNNIWSVEP